MGKQNKGLIDSLLGEVRASEKNISFLYELAEREERKLDKLKAKIFSLSTGLVPGMIIENKHFINECKLIRIEHTANGPLAIVKIRNRDGSWSETENNFYFHLCEYKVIGKEEL